MELAQLKQLKEQLISEINFYNSLTSIYTLYPSFYDEITKYSKHEINVIMTKIKEIMDAE